jgi:ubiquinone/menaquinone biosynthesis C-methylase UbiE
MPARPDYSSKAENYARYRWEYAPEAVAAIFKSTGIGAESIVADIGAGTGKLSRHFIGRVKRVYAIEPDPEMRRQAEMVFQCCSDCIVLDGTAEQVPLADESVDLITVAQAIHWFEPVLARQEFLRILKPAGWLALVRNYDTDVTQNEAINSLFGPPWRRIDASSAFIPFDELVNTYFGSHTYQRYIFPFYFRQEWLAFLGAVTATPGMPDEGTEDFPAFSLAAKEVFERCSEDGWMTVVGETEVILGRPDPFGQRAVG